MFTKAYVCVCEYYRLFIFIFPLSKWNKKFCKQYLSMRSLYSYQVNIYIIIFIFMNCLKV